MGRLAQYKYIDMHTAIKNALEIFKQVSGSGKFVSQEIKTDEMRKSVDKKI